MMSDWTQLYGAGEPKRSMNLEEIKTWRYQNSVYVDYNLNPTVAEMFDWLIAEVERLIKSLAFYHNLVSKYESLH